MKNFTLKIFGFLASMLFAITLSAQPAFWSEDFDGALPADWSAVEITGNGMLGSNWFWTSVGPTGPIPLQPLASASADNGWMIFDSDLNCNTDEAQEAWLVSPKVDLNDKDVVVLSFSQRWRRYADQINVQVSTDSMIWTQYPLSMGIEDTDYSDGTSGGDANPHITNVNISSSAANESQVWFAFQFLSDATTVTSGTPPGCAYSWQIDDVELYDYDLTPATDLALGDFFFPPLSFATPTTQIATDTMGFSGDVSNIGTADVTNVVLKATVTNSAGDLLFADSVIADVIPAGQVDSLLIVPTLYPPSTVQDVYTITYTLYSLDSDDADMSNNTASEQYVVTEDLWSKENGATIAYRPGSGGDYDIGNMYTTSNDWVETFYATSVDFSAAVNASDGMLSDFTTSIILLEIDEEEVLPDFADFDDASSYLTNPGLTIRSFELHQYAGESFDMQTVNLNDFDLETPSVELKPGNRYFIIASYESDNSVVFHAFSEEINYFQISTVIYNGQWFLGGFGPEPAAVLRMAISMNVAVEDKLTPEMVSTIYPNPVSDAFNLELNFEKPELTNVTIANMDGRVIQVDVLKNVISESKQYNVSHLAAGNYLVRVTTAEGSRTQKIVVTR